MPIIKTSYSANVAHATLFRGRVIKVERVTETRNWSDTLDYSDHRSTECTWALVYLGAYGVAPRDWKGRVVTHMEPASWETPRELTVGEWFAWVDCTNLFSDRCGYALTPEVDNVGDLLLSGGALDERGDIYDQLAAWEAHHKAVVAARVAEYAKKEAEYAAAAKLEAEKKAAREAKKAAKEAVLRSEAEALLARIPAKGTTVTVDGFTGKVFWVGVSKYYGKFNARAGVKDAKGTVAWIDAAKF